MKERSARSMGAITTFMVEGYATSTISDGRFTGIRCTPRGSSSIAKLMGAAEIGTQMGYVQSTTGAG
jgi:hypothetical protein